MSPCAPTPRTTPDRSVGGRCAHSRARSRWILMQDRRLFSGRTQGIALPQARALRPLTYRPNCADPGDLRVCDLVVRLAGPGERTLPGGRWSPGTGCRPRPSKRRDSAAGSEGLSAAYVRAPWVRRDASVDDAVARLVRAQARPGPAVTARAGQLRITQVTVGGAFPAEGALSYIRVERASGATVTERQLPGRGKLTLGDTAAD
jgi:hypothetical protein